MSSANTKYASRRNPSREQGAPPFDMVDLTRSGLEHLAHSLDETDEIDHLPLLPPENNYARRKAFEIEMNRYHDEPPGFFGDAWRLIASILLAACFLGPFLVSYLRNYHHRVTTSELSHSWPWNVNATACAKALDINFAQLHDQMLVQNTTFCREGESNTYCRCTNPVLPRSNTQHSQLWEEGRIRNIQLVSSESDVDVLLLGDSIMEQWLGTILSQNEKKLAGIQEVFQQLFGPQAGKYAAIPLGLAGDRCNELLFRIQNGELPGTLHPKVIWVLIGTNDYSDRCSRESILAGNIAVVKEIVKQKPNSKIVINSILPVGSAPLFGGDTTNERWKAYLWINARLKCLASTSKNFYFFNGTSYFLNENKNQINYTLMEDYLHPSKEGALLWGQGIVEKLHEIIG